PRSATLHVADIVHVAWNRNVDDDRLRAGPLRSPHGAHPHCRLDKVAESRDAVNEDGLTAHVFSDVVGRLAEPDPHGVQLFIAMGGGDEVWEIDNRIRALQLERLAVG